MDQNCETQIIKTLERLTYFAHKSTPLQCISPFYHAAQTLLKYADREKDIKKKQLHFQQFYTLFQNFAMSDFSQLKKHHEKILDQIAEIIESEAFIECIRPDLHNIRHLRKSLKKDKSQYSIINDLDQSKASWAPSIASTPFKQSRFDYHDETISQKSIDKGTHEQDIKQNKLQDLYKSIKKSYDDHCLDDAFQKTQDYLTLISNPNLIPPQKSNFLKNVSDQYEMMINFYSQFDKGEWKFDKEENGITLQYKIDEVLNMIAIRIMGEGEIPMQQFLAIISEIDLMGQYVPFCYDCKQLKKISRNQRIGHTKIYIPLLKDRETYLYAAGYDRMKTSKSLFFFSKTINDDVVYKKKYSFNVPPQDKYIRLEYKFFIVEYIPIGPTRAKIRLASKIDMKMDFIPRFILFRSARIFAFDYFKNIIDRVKHFKGSPWETKIKQNPDLYKFFRKKLDQYISK